MQELSEFQLGDVADSLLQQRAVVHVLLEQLGGQLDRGVDLGAAVSAEYLKAMLQLGLGSERRLGDHPVGERHG